MRFSIVFNHTALSPWVWAPKAWAAARPYVEPYWAAGPARARATTAAGAWQRLPKAAQERLIDAAAQTRAALVWAWLALLSLLTVRWDPTGSARRPIPVRIGRARTPAAVLLVAAATPLQLRLAAYFWRNRHEHTFQNLLALLAYHGGDPAAPIDVSGTIVFDPPPPGSEAARRGQRALPLTTFRLQIDLVAKTFTLTHVRVVAEEKTGAAVCAHAPAPSVMNAAGVDDALAPLLGRRLCPALMAGDPAKVG
jgi:hypothetical protein